MSRTWESVLLSWVPGFDGGETQTFHLHYTSLPQYLHGAYNLTVGTGNQFNVTGLQPDTSYNFHVYGVTVLGVGDISASLQVKTEGVDTLEFN